MAEVSVAALCINGDNAERRCWSVNSFALFFGSGRVLSAGLFFLEDEESICCTYVELFLWSK